MLSKEILILLDGDASISKLRKERKNILKLPGGDSPERVLANVLYNLPDSSPYWQRVARSYNKEVCFRDITYEDVTNDRKLAKDWFKKQKKYPKWLSATVTVWIEDNQEDFNEFKAQLVDYYKHVFLPEAWK